MSSSRTITSVTEDETATTIARAIRAATIAADRTAASTVDVHVQQAIRATIVRWIDRDGAWARDAVDSPVSSH